MLLLLLKLITFDGVCERHSNSSEWYIGHDMSKGMAESNWSQKCQELLIDWLDGEKTLLLIGSSYTSLSKDREGRNF